MNARDVLNKLLAGKGQRIERTMPIILRENVQLKLDLDFLIRHEIFRNGGSFHFIQIGANDGVSQEDDLFRYVRDYSASGVMVEPQPDMFLELQKNFSVYPDIVLVNKAIHANNHVMTLYSLNKEIIKDRMNAPHWASKNGIASFEKAHVLKHVKRIGLTDSVITMQEVPCITLDDILKSSARVPDILKVDAEGYDYEVLSMLNLHQCRPPIIHFEHLHMVGGQYDGLIRRMMAVGYRFLADKMNTTAYLIEAERS